MNQLSPNKKPLIGISANLLTVEAGLFAGQERTYVNHDYVTSILKAQGAPLLLPIISDDDMIAQQVDCVDGILLSGGYDVQPLFYGEEPQPYLEAICPQRDVYELKLIKYAVEQKKPILGICRGLQVLNVAFGGTLHQDISRQGGRLQHSQKAQKDVASHTVELVIGTQLQRLFDEEVIFTNSFHHQAIKDLAPGFIVSGKAKDGIIEGFEHPQEFIIGVQWHPELMVDRHPIMLKLFEALVAEASSYRSHAK